MREVVRMRSVGTIDPLKVIRDRMIQGLEEDHNISYRGEGILALLDEAVRLRRHELREEIDR